ncbi:MAG TPA: hypothetical protein VLH40_09210 [Atribacteraceae bacterium]|nr:hypothetical protein [Atribacteraceae bacterium]
MQKIAFFAFRDDETCFVHVLLSVLDFQARGGEAVLVFEGAATRLIPLLAGESHPLHRLYCKAKESASIEGAGLACSRKMGILDAVKQEGLPFLDELNGHPAMSRYTEQGYQVVVM